MSRVFALLARREVPGGLRRCGTHTRVTSVSAGLVQGRCKAVRKGGYESLAFPRDLTVLEGGFITADTWPLTETTPR